MSNLLGFVPDAARAVALDPRARHQLAESLETIFDSVDELNIDHGKLERVLGSIREMRVRPALFALYADLVERLFDDDLETAQQLSDLLVSESWQVKPFHLLNFDDRDVGSGQTERYLRYIDDDGDSLDLHAASETKFHETRELVTAAMDLLDRATPELAAEIRALIREVVTVASPGPAFGSGSSFYLWGAILLNVNRQSSPLDTALDLVHEAAHSLLFGMTLGEKLVENPDEDRQSSPLRSDPRPMDGVVHATYVIARMSYCLRRFLASGMLDSSQQEDAEQRLESFGKWYADGLAIIDAHARFTPDGGQAFAAARDYMSDKVWPGRSNAPSS